jgi:hypothetical protein
MRTILFAFLMVFSTQAVAFEIVMRCGTQLGSPENIYKYIQKGENKKVLRRLDADWVTWCQKQANTDELIAKGWGEEDTAVKINEKGAVCKSLVPFTPIKDFADQLVFAGQSYVFRRETILDFEFFTRTVKEDMFKLSEGIKPREVAPQYFTCDKVRSTETSSTTPMAKPSNAEFSQKIEPSSFGVEVKKCWVVDIASPAANVTVKLGFQLKADGKVKAGSIRLLEHNAKKNSWAKTAFQAARRAIIRCQKGGFNIPEGFDTSTQLTLEFNPETMR